MTESIWKNLLVVIPIAAAFGSSFVAAAYITQALVGYPIGGTRQGSAQAVEAALLFGGLLVGFAAGCVLAGFISRRFVAPAIRAKWDQEYEASLAEMPAAPRAVARLFGSLLRL